MLSTSLNEDEKDPLFFLPVNSQNLTQFRTQNSLLFPIQYPDKFYQSILQFETVKAYLVFRNEICVGSFSIREEPQQRWNEIVSGRTVDNFSPASSIEGERMYYIMTLGVLAVYRRLGIGAEILNSVIEYAKEMGIKCIGLHVHVENRTALNFYDRFGFQILGTVPNYYKKITPNSAYILELKLSEK